MMVPFLSDTYKLFAFQSPKNSWNGLCQDKNIKKFIAIKLEWSESLLLYMNENFTSELESYLNLKYSDIIVPVTTIMPDCTPEPYKDYIPVYKKRIVPNKGKQLCF